MSKNPQAYWNDRILRIFVDLDFPMLTTPEIWGMLNEKYSHNCPTMKGVSSMMGRSWIFKGERIMRKQSLGSTSAYPITSWVVKWSVE